MSRSHLPYPNVFNLIGYQAIWFGSILLGNAFVAVALVLVLIHFMMSTDRRREAIVLVACTILGFTCDTLWTLAGVYVFDPQPQFMPAPMWLFAIWLGFAATLRHGLRFAIDRPALGIALAALGAPLSYLAAGRLDAVLLPLGNLVTAGIISATWIVLMAVFIMIARRVDTD